MGGLWHSFTDIFFYRLYLGGISQSSVLELLVVGIPSARKVDTRGPSNVAREDSDCVDVFPRELYLLQMFQPHVRPQETATQKYVEQSCLQVSLALRWSLNR